MRMVSFYTGILSQYETLLPINIHVKFPPESLLLVGLRMNWRFTLINCAIGVLDYMSRFVCEAKDYIMTFFN